MTNKINKKHFLIGAITFVAPLALMYSLNSQLDKYSSEIKASVISHTESAANQWENLESLGSLVEINQNIENRRAFAGFKSVVDGSIVRTDKISVPVQAEIKYYKVGQDVRVAKRKDGYDVICIGDDIQHNCYMSSVTDV